MFLDKPIPRKKRKPIYSFFDYRNNQINQIGLILFLAFVIGTSLHYFFEQRFTEQRWKENPMRRYEMLDDILDRHLFINDTKKEVINQLGNPSIASPQSNQFNYYVGEGVRLSNDKPVMLTLFFKDNRVVKVVVLQSSN